MEFWGVEVKSGESLPVNPGNGIVLHLSQANLGEAKREKGSESISLYVTVDGKKLVLATLNTEKLPQQQFDLVFDKDFQISHNWKNGSIFFYGYLASNREDEDSSDDEFDSDEDILLQTNNGKPDTKSKPEKPAVVEKANASKDSSSGMKVKIAEPKKVVKDEDEDDSSDEDAEMDDDEDSETGEDEDGSDSEDDSEEESEETPKKVESSKKRPAESAKKTPVPEKKVKIANTPQKTDGKKGGSEHVATPHPSKKPGKTPANKGNQQTPKSAGSHQCKSCNRTFGSEGALDSHSKAKHSAGK